MTEKRTLTTMTKALRARTAPSTLVPALPKPKPVKARTLWPRVLSPAIAVAIFGAAVVGLRPQPAIAGGWAAVRQATLATPVRRFRHYFEGRLSNEGYEASGRVANVAYSRGKVFVEFRSDGKRFYQLLDFTLTKRPQDIAANARVTGVVRNVTYPNFRRPGEKSSRERIEELLKSGRAARSRNVPPGGGTWYDVRVSAPMLAQATGGRHTSTDHLVRAGADGRVAEVRDYGIGAPKTRIPTSWTLYDYPDTIPEGTFEPRPMVRAAPVIDIEATRREIVTRLRRGSVETRGVDLRLVALDERGKLFVFWTGPGVGEGTKGDVRLPGVRSDRSTGIAADLAQFESPARRGVAVAINRTMAGRAIVPRVRIGSTITVVIPGRGGEAVFRNVSVLRVHDLRYERDVLGYGVRQVFLKKTRR